MHIRRWRLITTLNIKEDVPMSKFDNNTKAQINVCGSKIRVSWAAFAHHHPHLHLKCAVVVKLRCWFNLLYYHVPLNNLSNPTCDRALLRVLVCCTPGARVVVVSHVCVALFSPGVRLRVSAWSAVLSRFRCTLFLAATAWRAKSASPCVRSCKRNCLALFFLVRLESALIYARRWGFCKCGFYRSFTWHPIYLQNICTSVRTRLFFLQEKYSNMNMWIYIYGDTGEYSTAK